jgi:putative Mg2+ transporter-C (MgtC) family protein
LAAGLIFGAIIGFERELHRQPAGFRTHSLVALGAALFTVVSAYGFTGPLVDPTRIAAQIVTGIGFIGAGTILQHRGHIRGLTTAASLWAVAAIGTAAGAGLFVIAGTGTVLILLVLSLLDWVEDYAKRQLGLGPSEYRLPDDQSGEGETERMP